MIPSSGGEASIPTLVSLATSLPQFQRPFTTTVVPISPKLASASDEDTLDKVRSHLMKDMYLLYEVSARTKVRTELLAQRHVKFDQFLRKLKDLGQIHERIEHEAKEL